MKVYGQRTFDSDASLTNDFNLRWRFNLALDRSVGLLVMPDPNHAVGRWKRSLGPLQVAEVRLDRNFRAARCKDVERRGRVRSAKRSVPTPSRGKGCAGIRYNSRHRNHHGYRVLPSGTSSSMRAAFSVHARSKSSQKLVAPRSSIPPQYSSMQSRQP